MLVRYFCKIGFFCYGGDDLILGFFECFFEVFCFLCLVCLVGCFVNFCKLFFVVFWGGGRDCGVEFFEVGVLLIVVVVKVDYVDKVVVLDDVF